MKLQRKILFRYKQLFPSETLKETSQKTGIQITRVFRLFNGLAMRVNELEAFENVIQKRLNQSPSTKKLNTAIESALATLTCEELESIVNYIERRVVSRSYLRTYISPVIDENQIIA